MSLEDFNPDIDASEWWWQSGEVSKEVSEKYKESTKKSQAWIKKTKKDEKKAKRYDFLLARFLVELILKKKYDKLLNSLFICLDEWYGTNFLLWIISLVYPPISNKIRLISNKWQINFIYDIKNERTLFDDNNIDLSIKNRISDWIEDIEWTLLIESSEIVSEKILSLLKDDEKIIIFIWEIFVFFFNELNIDISKQKTDNYSTFIISELTKTLKKSFLDN